MIAKLLWILAFLVAGHILTTWLAAFWRGSLARRSICRTASPPIPERWPFVTVIVPAWRECGMLDTCINSLRAVDYPAWETILVAGGPDGTFQSAIEQCKNLENVRVIEQQPYGKNAALNQGLRMARGEVIVLLDADSQVSPQWLYHLVAPIGKTFQATTGQPVPFRKTSISLGEQMEFMSARSVHGIVTLQGSGSIALHRKAIEEIGAFPEEVLVGVDWDLDARLAAHGIARAVCPQACVLTQRPATLSEYWRNEIRWRRAHFASLFRLSAYFLGNPISAVSNLYIYALAWFTILFTLLVSLIALFVRGELRIAALGLWAIFIAWVLIRRAALTGEIAAFSGNPGWLKLAGAPVLLLCVTLTAIVPATLTLKRNLAHFKGPR